MHPNAPSVLDSMSSDVYFSASQLAKLGSAKVIHMPKTERNAREAARRAEWPCRDVDGGGGAGGVRTEYQPPADMLALIHSFLETNPDFFKKKRGKIYTHTVNELRTQYQVKKLPITAPDGFILVPRYDVAASMGNGTVIHSEQIVDHLAFRAEWVRTELSANPNNLVLISAIGDSMEPTLRAGDLLLIDRSDAGVKQDAIYAFATNGELRVKRMQLKIDGSVVVKSDNPQYEAEFLSSDQVIMLRIVGRVVWSGRRM